MRRRQFLQSVIGTTAVIPISAGRLLFAAPEHTGVTLTAPTAGDDIFAYLQRTTGAFDDTRYKQILGAANTFKEGDQLAGIAAADDASRTVARELLSNTRLKELDAHPVLTDDLHRLLQKTIDSTASPRTRDMTCGTLKEFLLGRDEADIKAVMHGLSSDVIGCVVKLMTNDELIAIGAKIFNPLPGSNIGAKGYLGARIQPNSPTDNVDDIRWQVLDGWSYAVGDVVLGNNPVSSEPASVAAIERTLQDLLHTFGLTDVFPHCVLAHVDVQAEVERKYPGSTALWFQSIAGCDTANATFDISVEKMLAYAASRTGRYGLYFETGQGADFTNGHDHGFDMVLHESRKYGFARALKQNVGRAQRAAGAGFQPWVHLNDVAGFIGPEVFRTREQLVRCCLEDIVMGKLHGLCIGLDVCSTLHMDVSLDDLDWCLDHIMPANPAYLMALPTKIDPMLGYLTTGFQDHVRLREKFGYKVDDRTHRFFVELGVLDGTGKPTEHFGDPVWVYLQYRRKKGDRRRDEEIIQEGESQLAQVADRGVFIARGHGRQPWDLAPQLKNDVTRIYVDAKKSIWSELDPAFVANIPNVVRLKTQSLDRTDYILHPKTGESLSPDSVKRLHQLKQTHAGRYNVQVVVSDGLNALSIMDDGQLAPFLHRLREELDAAGDHAAPENLVVTSGRVRAGYRIGEAIFAGLDGPRAIVHVIGERPGSGHHTFSIYITAPPGGTWAERGKVDHNITKVVSGVAVTALPPTQAADDVVRLLHALFAD